MAAEGDTAAADEPHVDSQSGFCAASGTFHSLRPPVPLPPEFLPLSFTAYALSLLPDPLPDNPALLDAVTARTLSYRALLDAVHNLAAAFRSSSGLSQGDVAFILAPSCLEIPILYLALLSFGAVVCPANPACTHAEIARLVRLAEPRVAFAVSATKAKLPPHLAATAVLLDSPRFQSLLSAPPGGAAPLPVVVRQSDPAAIQFSSGTTGAVKAAVLPHRSFVAQAAEFYAPPRPEGWRPGVALVAAPLFHSVGFFAALRAVALGETAVVMAGRAGPGDIVAAAERHRATHMTTATPVVVAMARSSGALSHDLGDLRWVLCGGAPLPEAAAKRFQARFPHVNLYQGYGLTEAVMISRMVDPEDSQRIRSVGRLIRNVEAKIIDNITGRAIPVGQCGELVVRGPNLMTGYIGDDAANASTFNGDGWLKTGDLCYFDHDGFLFVVDRMKELIKYKAYQVPPAELEQLLQSIPEILDVAVVPYPDEEAGQLPMAFVVREPGSKLSEAQVMDFVAQKVAPYKKIRKVAFIESIPKSAGGKILRKELANRAFQEYVSLATKHDIY